MKRGCRLLLLLLACAPAPVARTAEEDVVALPPFIVEHKLKADPWRYGEAPGFEVLSRCPDVTTRELVAHYQRLHALLAEILPESLQVRFTQPRTLIFFDERMPPAASQEVLGDLLRNAERDRAPRNPAIPFGRMQAVSPRVTFVPNLRLTDRDAMCVFSFVGDYDPNGSGLTLTQGYVSYLLRNRAPTLPRWFVAAFLELYPQVQYEADAVRLEPADWIAEAFADAAKAEKKRTGKDVSPLIPLAGFFGAGMRLAANGAPPLRLWVAQAGLLIRWALDGKGAPRREGFFKLIGRAVIEPVSESLFQECIGCDFAAADQQLAAYLHNGVERDLVLTPAQPPRPSSLALRIATETEVSRIKGDWERLEIPYVKAKAPAVASRYIEQAKRTALRAYEHDSRDPRLLAVLGLLEADIGDEPAARGYLEAAAAHAPTLRPRAAYELARLRFAEAVASPGAADGRLTASQAAKVLELLFIARRQQPPLPEVYDLIAQVWSHCAARPSRGHLAALDEGLMLFPGRTELAYQAVQLNLHHGFNAEASSLFRFGLRFAPDEAARSRLATLQAEIDAASK